MRKRFRFSSLVLLALAAALATRAWLRVRNHLSEFGTVHVTELGMRDNDFSMGLPAVSPFVRSLDGRTVTLTGDVVSACQDWPDTERSRYAWAERAAFKLVPSAGHDWSCHDLGVYCMGRGCDCWRENARVKGVLHLTPIFDWNRGAAGYAVTLDVQSVSMGDTPDETANKSEADLNRIAFDLIAASGAAVLLLFSARRRAGVRLTHRRLSSGRCVKCGYDLRGSPARCPECGAVPGEGVVR